MEHLPLILPVDVHRGKDYYKATFDNFNDAINYAKNHYPDVHAMTHHPNGKMYYFRQGSYEDLYNVAIQLIKNNYNARDYVTILFK